MPKGDMPRRILQLHLLGEEDEEDEDMDDPDEAIPCKKESLCTCIQKMCLWLVCLEYFDYVMGLAILANAVLMGVQADIAVQNARTGAKEPPVIRAVAVALGAVFTAELVIRILAYRVDFFTKPGWRWNVFDFLLVFLQLSEEVVTVLVYENSDAVSVNLSFMRILRVLRLVRIVRLVRVLRLIRELRTLVQSIASTMTSLLWTVVLLLLLIFVVGICFTQVVADVGLEAPQLIQEGTDTFEYYGSLLRSVMSLYQSITSGISWRDASQPLERHQPIMGLVFAVYIAFAALAMLNVITGVFVESAMASAREENNVTVVSRMRELVSKMEIGESGRMTWEQFEGQLNNPIMEAYFKSLDLSVTEAESLFRLLDIDNEGSIDVEEFIAGCCRIHGPAKAIDLTTLMCQVMLLHRQWRSHAMLLEERPFCACSRIAYLCGPWGCNHRRLQAPAINLRDVQHLTLNRRRRKIEAHSDMYSTGKSCFRTHAGYESEFLSAGTV
ncbi:scn4aa [Symbiodinium sp. CCMP2456]|nr:scn4aa [Symbiodinium sp. CCMP2456]